MHLFLWMHVGLVANTWLFFLCRYPLAGSKLQESVSTSDFHPHAADVGFLQDNDLFSP